MKVLVLREPKSFHRTEQSTLKGAKEATVPTAVCTILVVPPTNLTHLKKRKRGREFIHQLSNNKPTFRNPFLKVVTT